MIISNQAQIICNDKIDKQNKYIDNFLLKEKENKEKLYKNYEIINKKYEKLKEKVKNQSSCQEKLQFIYENQEIFLNVE